MSENGPFYLAVKENPNSNVCYKEQNLGIKVLDSHQEKFEKTAKRQYEKRYAEESDYNKKRTTGKSDSKKSFRK